MSYLEYFRFVEMMNRLVTSFPGEHVVGGLSLGAALASYATVQAPYLWSHQVLLSPLYELDPSNLRNGLGTLTNINNLSHRLGALLKPVLHRSQGWGKGCEDERDPNYLAKLGRTQTRAGICQFQLTHILASNQFGFDVWNLVQPTQVKTQVVMVQEDPLLHKQMVFHSVGRMRGERLLAKPYTSEVRLDDDPFVRVCYIPSSQATCSSNQSKPLSDQDKPCVNHSLLSRFDAPFQNKYWIPTIEEKIVRFLNDGQFFATENLHSENDPLCAGFR